MCVPTDVEGQVRNHGYYDPVPYRFWSYPKTARNYYENRGVEGLQNFSHTNDLRLSNRYILPRYLCFLDARSKDNPRGRLTPQEWMDKHDTSTQPSFIFISYTGEKQFGRPCPIGGDQFKTSGINSCPCE